MSINTIKSLDLSNHTALWDLWKRTYSTNHEVLDVIWTDKQWSLLWHQEVTTTSSSYGHVSYAHNEISKSSQQLVSEHSNTHHIIESHTHPDMSSSLSQRDINIISNSTQQNPHLLRIKATINGQQGLIYRLFQPENGNINAVDITHGWHKADSKDTFLRTDSTGKNINIIRKEEIASCLSQDSEDQIK